MTNKEADNLIATLPKPGGGLQLFREDDQIVMTGGKTGSHAISAKVSSAERLLAHWKGYVENQGLSLGPGYTTERPAPTLKVTPKDARGIYVADHAAYEKRRAVLSEGIITHLKSSERDYQPGDKIAFSSPSYSGKRARGYRPGVVIRATPKRVLVEYSFKYDFEEARRTGQPLRRHQVWKKRSEVRKR